MAKAKNRTHIIKLISTAGTGRLQSTTSFEMQDHLLMAQSSAHRRLLHDNPFTCCTREAATHEVRLGDQEGENLKLAYMRCRQPKADYLHAHAARPLYRRQGAVAHAQPCLCSSPLSRISSSPRLPIPRCSPTRLRHQYSNAEQCFQIYRTSLRRWLACESESPFAILCIPYRSLT